MEDSDQKKGPLAIVMAIVALGALGLKSGCVKLFSQGDEAVRAIGSTVRHTDAADVAASASHAATIGHATSTTHAEEELASKVGKELLKSGAEEGAQAGVEAYQESRESSPTPVPTRRK